MNLFETVIVKYLKYLDYKGRKFNIVLGIVCTALIGLLDVVAPDKTSFSFMYLFPIGFVTWYGGKWAGLIISLICSALWSLDIIVADNILISTWNVLSTFAIFCTVSFMLHKIRKMLENERELSRKDHLTGVMNLRAFSELVEYEILRLQREGSPFSIAYVDLDDFKTVNDSYGHKRGDELLKHLIAHLVENLRKTDVIARIGGDEFAVFLPATDHESVKIVIEKVREQFQGSSEQNQWVTSLSIGVLTCTDSECDLEKILSIADHLMYEVKKSGKNNVRYGELTPVTK